MAGFRGTMIPEVYSYGTCNPSAVAHSSN